MTASSGEFALSKEPAVINALQSLQSSTNPAILIDQNYRILAANSAYLSSYEPNDDIVNRRCYDVSHGYQVPCDQAGETCPLQRVRETLQPYRVLHVHKTNKGDEHVYVETRPVFDSEQRLIAFTEILNAVPIGNSTDKLAGTLIGKSPAFNKMMELVQRGAPSEANVLLLGESGTGKELVARAVHSASNRSKGEFVPVDCSGLTDTLFESELFGHEKGAFTGAHQAKPGLIDAAEGGTLFLDEVGDIPLGQQVKLLRLLETSRYRRVGCVKERQAEFRLICATHRNLVKMVEEGTFREDLYYRLSTFPIQLPPLRERKTDIPVLIDSLLDHLWTNTGERPRMDISSLKALVAYDYPGNIRQLRNLLERALLLTDGELIFPESIPEICGEDQSHYGSEGDIVTLEEQEQRYLLQVNARFQGEKRDLANRLGISERTLYRKLENARKAYLIKTSRTDKENLK